MTRAQAIARVRATCGAWWPETFPEFNAQKEGRFRCRALEAAVVYAWRTEHRPEEELGKVTIGCVQEAELCAHTCQVCKAHERLAPAPKETT